MIITFLSEKGGVGKTTLAINVAHELQLRGRSVLLVDADPIGSATDWHARGEGEVLAVVRLDIRTIDKDISKLKDKYDYIIIDPAPSLKETVVPAILCSDIILLPVQPTPFDMWGPRNTVELVKQRQQIAEGKPKTAFVISKEEVGTSLGKECRGVLEGYELPVFKAGSCRRQVYAEVKHFGKTVLTSNNNLAKNEIKSIVNELLEFINA